jgi:hypothetical protein
MCSGGSHGSGLSSVWERRNERTTRNIGNNAVRHVGACEPDAYDITGSRAERHRSGAATGARTRVGHTSAAGERRTIGEGARFGCADSGQQR